MTTRGVVTVHAEKEAAFHALAAACKDMHAKIKHLDSSSYTIDGESGMIWLQNRFSFTFPARLVDQYDGAVVEVSDFSPFRDDKRFIGKLFGKLKKRISISEPSYGDAQQISNPGPSYSPVYLGPSDTDAPPATLAKSTAEAFTPSGAPFVMDGPTLRAREEPAAKVENPQVPTQAGGLVCRQCGWSNTAGSAFCSKCGSNLIVLCPNCSKDNSQGPKFCRHCGAKL
jgi:hypothetical protein